MGSGSVGSSHETASDYTLHRQVSLHSILQRVMNGAARVLTNMRKFDRGMTHARRHDIHWLDVPDRVKYRLFTNAYMEWHHSTCLISVRL